MTVMLYVSVMLVRAVVTFLTERGIDRAQVFAGLRLHADVLDDTMTIVDVADWHPLVARAYALTRDPSFGLTLGKDVAGDAGPFLTQMALSCGTAREAIQMLQRYTPLVGNASTFELIEEGAFAHLTYDSFADIPELPRFASELALSLLYRTAQKFVWGPNRGVSEVWFAHPAPQYAARYADVFQCKVRFSRPHNALILPRALLDQAQPLSDLAMRAMLQPSAENLLRAHSQSGISDRIRNLLHHSSDVRGMDTARVAKALNLLPRSLERELADANSSLAQLRHEVSYEIACGQLARSDTAIKAIAARLGFSSVSAFHRAFKRWTGRTPADYRRAGSPTL